MMTISLRIPVTEDQAAELVGQVLLIVPLTAAELDLFEKATVAQAGYIEANRTELAAHLLREEALGVPDAEYVRQLRALVEVTKNLTAASLLIRDILRRRLVIAPGTDGYRADQWGRA